MTFAKWIDTFLSEKGIDLKEGFEVEGVTGVNFMAYENVVHAMKQASKIEQAQLKGLLVKVDFHNGDVRHCLRHLAKAIAL